jgi:hypothetical protein
VLSRLKRIRIAQALTTRISANPGVKEPVNILSNGSQSTI